MFRIALCDDEIEQLDLMEKIIGEMLQQVNVDYVVDKFKSGESLLEITSLYDVAFLDIEMSGMLGIEVARILLEKNPDIEVVFVSGHEEMVFESIRVRPLRFVRKRFLVEELVEAVDIALEIHKKRAGVIRFGSGKSELEMIVSDIIYVETSGHYLEITTKSGKYKVRGKITDYLEEFKIQDFLQIQKGIVVNMQRIELIKGDKVHLDNGMYFNISRGSRDMVKKKFLKFMRKGM